MNKLRPDTTEGRLMTQHVQSGRSAFAGRWSSRETADRATFTWDTFGYRSCVGFGVTSVVTR